MATGYNFGPVKLLKLKETNKKIKFKRYFKNFKLLMQQNTKAFFRNSTLHGLSYLTKKDLYPMERAFFAIAFVTVVCIAGFFIVNVYNKWISTPVIFSINPQPTFITNEPFPALTICNMNQAYKSKAMQYANNSEEYAIIQMLCKREIDLNVAKDHKNWTALNQFISEIKQPCENMLLSCRFGGIDYNCDRIFHSIITDEGVCCAFNMVHPKFMYTTGTSSLINETSINLEDEYVALPWNSETGYPEKMPKKFYPRTAAGTGESLGLTIILDVEADEYYCSSTNSIGFKMAMHSPTETPNVREVGLLVAAGYETKARVRMEKLEADKKLHHVALRHRQCQFQDEHQLVHFATYTQPNCETECVSNSLQHHCGCISHYLPKRFANETVCGIYDMQCVERIRLHSMLNDDDDDERECDEVCLPSCNELRFYAEFFTSPLQHSGFKIGNRKIHNFSEAYVEKNVAILTMYYKDNSFRSSKQTEFIGMTDVLSSVGGLLGLFFGFSFISLAEILFYTFVRPCRKDRIVTPKRKSAAKNRRAQQNSDSDSFKFRARPFKSRKKYSANTSIFRVSPRIPDWQQYNVDEYRKDDTVFPKDKQGEKAFYYHTDWRMDQIV